MRSHEQRDDRALQARAVEITMELAHAHGFDCDATLQEAIADALCSFAHAEGQTRLRSALSAEYAAVLARRGTWRRGICPEEEMERAICALGADRAIKNIAQRCGLVGRQWDELGERAQLLAASQSEERAP